MVDLFTSEYTVLCHMTSRGSLHCISPGLIKIFSYVYLQVMAIHSQSASVPLCPRDWTEMWIGYSFAMVCETVKYNITLVGLFLVAFNANLHGTSLK